MKISPSIASADILRIADEVQFTNQYFDDIHLDVADGIAVGEISFGIQMCRRICEIATLPISLHLEVSNPLQYVEQVKQGNFDMVFIQVDCLTNAKEVVGIYRANAIPVGINLSNLDLEREDLRELLEMTGHVLINTTYHNDIRQSLRREMLDYAIRLANETEHKVWIDGAINWDIIKEIQNSNIYAAVMGRAVFSDKANAVREKKNLFG